MYLVYMVFTPLKGGIYMVYNFLFDKEEYNARICINYNYYLLYNYCIKR